MAFVDYYKILGVEVNSTKDEIKTAYRKLSKKFHPDVNDNDKYFEDRFKDIQSAFEVLSDDLKREKYNIQYQSFHFGRFNNNTGSKDSNTYKPPPPPPKPEPNHQPQNKKTSYTSSKHSDDRRLKKNRTYILLPSIIFCIAIAVFLSSLFKTKSRNSDSYGNTQFANPDVLPITDVSSLYDTIKNKSQDVVLIIDSSQSIALSSLDSDSYSFWEITGDDSKEIVTEVFTGGAHCCFVYDIFKKLDQNVYKRIFSFVGGEGSLAIESSKISIYPFEQIGYFYSCYACHVSIPNSNFTPVINLRYKNDDFVFESNSNLNSIIESDLQYLKQRGIPDLDEDNIDDGTRKAVAGYIVTYFFNNDLDVEQTKAFFESNYFAADAEVVWDKILLHIENVFAMNHGLMDYMEQIKARM